MRLSLRLCVTAVATAAALAIIFWADDPAIRTAFRVRNGLAGAMPTWQPLFRSAKSRHAASAPFSLLSSWRASELAGSNLSNSRLLSVHWADLNHDSFPDLLIVSSAADTETEAQAERSSTVTVTQLIGSPGAANSSDSAFRWLPVLSSRSATSRWWRRRLTLPSGLQLSALAVDVDRDYDMDLLLAVSQLNASRPAACAVKHRLDSGKSDACSGCAAVQTVQSASVLSSRTAGGRAAAAALTALDVNFDGELELLQADSAARGDALSSQAAVVWRVDNQTLPPPCLQSAAQPALLRPDAVCLVTLLALLDGDSRPELLCIGPDFPRDLRVFHVNAAAAPADVTAAFTPQPSGRLAAAASHRVRDACMGDYNGDGRADFVLATRAHGVVLWFSRQHRSRQYQLQFLRPGWAEQADAAVPHVATALSVACLDADNDGNLDVFALYAVRPDNGDGSGSNALYSYDPTLRRLRFRSSVPGLSGSTLAVADYDSDGWLDLLVADSDSFDIYRNELRAAGAGPHHHWLELSLWGMGRSNTFGRGAVVSVTADGQKAQTRVVLEPSSSLSPYGQHHHRLHFGLGSHSAVQQLQVHWPRPTGVSLHYDNVQADQQLVALELGTGQQLLPDSLRAPLAGYHFRSGPCARTREQRLVPSFFIIGLWKCGTSSLAASLMRHPGIVPAVVKEIHYYTGLSRDLGLDWYLQQFPCGDPRLRTFEASAGYFFKPGVAAAIVRDFPRAQYVVLLRDPVDRAFSHFRMQHWRQVDLALSDDAKAAFSSRHFHDEMTRQVQAIAHCVLYAIRNGTAEGGPVGGEAAMALNQSLQLSSEQMVDPSVVPFSALYDCVTAPGFLSFFAPGLYAVQLQHWLTALSSNGSSPEQLLMLASEQFFAQPDAVLQSVHRFIGVQPINSSFVMRNAGRRMHMLPETRDMLRRAYRPFNAWLHSMRPFHDGYVPDWIAWKDDKS